MPDKSTRKTNIATDHSQAIRKHEASHKAVSGLHGWEAMTREYLDRVQDETIITIDHGKFSAAGASLNKSLTVVELLSLLHEGRVAKDLADTKEALRGFGIHVWDHWTAEDGTRCFGVRP